MKSIKKPRASTRGKPQTLKIGDQRMSSKIDEPRVPFYSFSDLEKIIKELTRLQKENITLLFEISETKKKILAAQYLAEIEKKVYSGIKKYFK